MSAGVPNQARYSLLASTSTTAHVTSPTEVAHIAFAFVVLTADLVVILSGRGLLEGGTLSGLLAPVPLFWLLLAIAAGSTGFIAHEMAHKLAARRLGYWAEFRIWPTGLLLSLVTSLAGFLFAAPGATVVEGMGPTDVQGWGRVAVAGPVSNLLFAAGFYSASLATFGSDWITGEALLFLAMINTLFATFNLLPIDPLDGAKVLRWGVGRWIATFAVAVATLAVASTAFYFFRSPFPTW
jgi:Zn-dependent protease